MTHRLDVARRRNLVTRWCALAEQRLEYLTELFESGRWRRFHSELALLENIQEAKAAVETWRDLSSHEASFDNTAIDMSRLGRTTAPPRGERRRDFVQPMAVEISAERPPGISILRQAGTTGAAEVLLAQPTYDEASELTPGIAVIAERYPLLRNAL